MNEFLKAKSTVETSLVNLILKLTGAKLFIKKTVKDLVSGYDDSLFKMARFFRPNLIKTDKFSILNGRNGTAVENMTISTGLDNINTLGQILAYNGKKSLDFWYSKEANTINGTEGTLYSPFLSRYNRLYLFNPEMCRSLHLDYLRDRDLNNINIYDFHLPENIFYNSSLNPENNGFCDSEKGCFGNGVLDITSCFGAKGVYLSKPHYLDAEERFNENVIGLKPNREKHDILVSLEPV
jgi:lysosome membrane protein 2